MPVEFMEELPADGEEALNHCLRAFDLDKLLGTLYEFIETHVKHSPSTEKEWPYVECLPTYELICVYDDTLQACTLHAHGWFACTWLVAC